VPGLEPQQTPASHEFSAVEHRVAEVLLIALPEVEQKIANLKRAVGGMA
jgi:hypothetical protein